MKAKHIYLLLYVFLNVGVLVNSFDPLTTWVVVGVGAGLGRTLWNYFQESCEPKWISFNATGDRLRASWICSFRTRLVVLQNVGEDDCLRRCSNRCLVPRDSR